MTGEPGRLLVSIEFPEDSLSAIIFKYNDAGDITRIFNTTDTALYEYKGDSILLSWIDGMSHTVAMQKFSTGPDGKIMTNHIFDPSGKLFAITTYTYNLKGQVTEQVRTNAETDDAFKMSYTYDGDNLSKVAVYKNDRLMDMFVYEYDPKTRNMFEVDIDNLLNDYFAHERLGKKNKNLMSKAYRINASGDTTVARKFTYMLDKDGYVISRTDTDVEFGYLTERRFKYE